ncbi:response regulator [Gordonia sp. HNM0687]|uniref:Response regulator n=1 Tax=Gordonia mangrovi TaxID=2665643 RepID=A0A6L7GVU3_9ACTN|nr:response regulator transcription factor [Gordonia mangrovi]MDY6809055.1 response regulator transcription factor [Actinomycetota bacterium]MXP22755.1 response regulator [Gordonia mangrovi]UVF77070.1 response regulator transcription factor [Gordonia mangrovi]
MHALVVDDDSGAAETVRRMLVTDGWAVTVAHDGTDGLWRASEGHFDVIVLDILMPGMNGFAVLRELRTRDIWTPVLVLTAKDGEYDEAEALDFGADDYLVKPFSVVVLKARLRALLRRGAPERPAQLVVDDLVLDPADHTVRRGNSPISLTPREFAVLEYLIRNTGTVVSKADILHSVWDQNFEGDPNIVEVYIAYLRKRVDAPFGVRSIVTVRGAGYRIG